MTLFQRHCSDETLICHLDGELPFYAKAPVHRHLERCWQCRLRLSEIEAQVLAATRAMKDDAFPGPQRMADARAQFLSQADRIAAEVFQARRGPAWIPGRPRPPSPRP
jgi:anti-sigma factor RsiW